MHLDTYVEGEGELRRIMAERLEKWHRQDSHRNAPRKIPCGWHPREPSQDLHGGRIEKGLADNLFSLFRAACA